MSYTASYSFNAATGLTLKWSLVSEGTLHATLRNQTTGFYEAGTSGYYEWKVSTIPDDFVGQVVWHTGSDLTALSDLTTSNTKGVGSIDKVLERVVAYLDVAVSSRLAPTTAGRTLAVEATSGAVTLANTAHGGTSATLRLGGSTETPALYITNSGGDAARLEGGGATGDGLHVSSVATSGHGFHVVGTEEGIHVESDGGPAIGLASPTYGIFLDPGGGVGIGGSGGIDVGTITGVSASVDTGAIADAVWDEAASGHTTVGTFGAIFAFIHRAIQTLRGKP